MLALLCWLALFAPASMARAPAGHSVSPTPVRPAHVARHCLPLLCVLAAVPAMAAPTLYRRRPGYPTWIWAGACMEVALLRKWAAEMRRNNWVTRLVYAEPEIARSLTSDEQLAQCGQLPHEEGEIVIYRQLAPEREKALSYAPSGYDGAAPKAEPSATESALAQGPPGIDPEATRRPPSVVGMAHLDALENAPPYSDVEINLDR